jgi:AcrR family transcriptional regulator
MESTTKDQNRESNQKSRGRPRDEDARERILASALDVFEELGFASATTDAIAERAGASKATIYRWWPNKSAVLIEALRERIARESPFPNTGNLRSDIYRQVQNFIDLLNSRRGRILRAFIAASQTDPEVAEAFRTVWMQPRRAEAQEVLRSYQESGAIRPDVSLESTLDLLYGPIYFRLLMEHAPLSAEFGDQVASLALAGIEVVAESDLQNT